MNRYWNRLGMFVFFALLLGVVGCPPMDGEPQEGESDTVPYVDVSVAEAHQLWAEGVFVLDVRTASEFASGHIPSASNISSTELATRLDELSAQKDSPMLVYCASGRRSAVAAQLLSDEGFPQVNNMLGGFSAWSSTGYDVE